MRVVTLTAAVALALTTALATPALAETAPPTSSPSPTAPPSASPPAAEAALVFALDGYRPVPVASSFQPWHRAKRTWKTDGGLDASGVVMKLLPDGNYYDHPVGQATYGLRSLHTWRLTGDSFYLDRARAQADRLVSRRLEARGAWWYPYSFDFTLRDSDVVMTAPWYSGMSQGEALSLFTQLAAALAPDDPAGSQLYRQAADATFRSLQLGPEQQPWVSMTDATGYLWVQEYPQEPKEESDFTYNGYGFAALGIWDYWNLTRSEEAAALFDGAVTTLVAFNDEIRNPLWASSYSMRNRWPHVNYHVIHTSQLLQLSWLTGRSSLAALSDTYFFDYPASALRGTVAFAAGTHALFRFNADGSVAARRTFSPSRSTSAPTMARVRVLGRGLHYRITAGPFLDWYVEERPGASWLRGIYLERQYAPYRSATLPAGRAVVLATFAGDGTMTGRRTITPAQDTSLAISRQAVINGRVCLLVATGTWRGSWLVRNAASLT